MVCMSLFKMFDGAVDYSGSILSGMSGVVWVMSVWLFMLYFVGEFVLGYRGSMVITHLVKVYSKLYPMGASSKNCSGFVHFLVGLCLFILSLNIGAMIPGVIGWTSQVVLPVCLGFGYWGSVMLMRGWNSFGTLMASLTPEGSPMAIAPLLVVIELVSIVARPFTLSGRLVANMVAGHVILYLIGVLFVMLCLFGWWKVVLSLVVGVIGLTVYECVVCFLQSYIFGLLVGLYAQE